MTRMWIALPAAAIYAAYLAVLRRQTLRNRATPTQGDTHVVVAVSPRAYEAVRGQNMDPMTPLPRVVVEAPSPQIRDRL